MLKTVATLTYVMLLWSFARASLQAGETAMNAVPIPKLNALKIDGQMDDWGALGVRVTAFAEDALPPLEASAFSAELRVGWTEAGLAVLVTLRSDQPWHEVDDTRNAFRSDSIELFLRQGSAWKNLVQAVITPGLAKDGVEARRAMWDYRGDPKEWAELPAECELARAKIEGGARIEALLPWRQLRLEARAGLEVEFRINLNKTVPGQGRRQFVWSREDGDAFQRLALSDAPDETRIETAGWIRTGDPERIGVAVVAPAARAGARLRLRQGETELLDGALRAQGARSSASFWVPVDAIDPARGALELFLDGQRVHAAQAPDTPRELALDLERALIGRRYGRQGDTETRLNPVLPVVLEAGALPQARFPEPELARRAGALSLETAWYDAEGHAVTQTSAAGRYGAVLTVTFKAGHVVRGYRSAVLLDPARLEGLRDALGLKAEKVDRLRELLAPGLAEQPQLVAALLEQGAFSEEAERLWWHRLRTKLGFQTVYPYARRMPKDYDASGERRWPAILYLHGSGGRLPSEQASMEERVASGANRDLLGWAGGNPQEFALYALQSNGGWEPPAVIDALERILKEDRIDPDRVILMGFSMGGMGTWNVITEHAGRFAAAVPIGGRSGRVDEMARLGALPVWIVNGDADQTTTLHDARRGEAALKAAGGNVRFTVLPGVGHGGSQNGTFETEGMWEWLSAQRRSAREK
ncbi:MAG: prolyl oligopeptidase family serine peptidase [Planctomycetota bacterium]|nr:prolyl oligopeptidase family serine peptidase [Planctomycetota bacterium]